MARICGILLIFIMFTASAAFPIESKPLLVDQAFQLSATLNADQQIVLHWKIAPNYYLYQQEIALKLNDLLPVKPALPPGIKKQDELHGKFQAYFNQLTLFVPDPKQVSSFEHLTIRYQGCSSAGFCYPPVTKKLVVNLVDRTGPSDLTPYLVTAPKKIDKEFVPINAQSSATALFSDHSFVAVLLSFMGLGLLLAFTPCVLPMVPILSSIIVGQRKGLSTAKALGLSAAYVLGMALTYAFAGIVIAEMGSNIQVVMQKPIVIVLFSTIFLALALSLFGVFELRLSAKLHQRLHQLNSRFSGGNYFGVFMMGVLATLVVSPCVSAPLVGVLTYIAKTGNVWLGGSALFALGLGMGVPLLLVGTSAGRLLPKSGPWMEAIKHLFGVVMLGMAIMMLSRILPGTLTLFLWAVVFVIAAILLWQISHSKILLRHLNRGFCGALLIYSGILLSGAWLGNSDPWHPLALPTLAQQESTPFIKVKNNTELNLQLALAKAAGKKVLLDFYADWCAACVDMDRHVFNQPQLQASLNGFVLLRADVTKNDSDDHALMAKFHIIAPPSIVFFDHTGTELTADNIVGEVNANQLIANLKQIQQTAPTVCDTRTQAC